MHSTKTMNSSDFDFYLNQKLSSIEEIFPNFNQKDRLGIVVSTPGGSLGASSLIMAAITKFYDYYRSSLGNEEGSLRIYPDYYIFHVRKQYMEHNYLDIFPASKEVVVENDAKKVLDAINDRGITRLLVENVPEVSEDFTREAYNSALFRVETAITYTNKTPFEQITAQVKGPPIIEKYIKACLKRSENLNEEMYSTLREDFLKNDNGKIVESLQHISLDKALKMLNSPIS